MNTELDNTWKKEFLSYLYFLSRHLLAGKENSIHGNFYRCAVHFETYVVHSPTNALFINLVKSFKFTLKYTIMSLLRVSVFNDHHQGALSVPNYSYIYVKTLGKITSQLHRNFTECLNINIILVRYR